MKSKQFLWLNIILSSNIIFGLGVVCYFLISVFCYINEDKPCICYVTNNVKTIYILCVLYILIKIIVFPCLLLKKYKHTFSYKFLKKFLLNKIFRSKILLKVIVSDFLFNFVPLICYFYLIEVMSAKTNHTEFDFTGFILYYFVLTLFLYILFGTGVFLSYLSLILFNKTMKILKFFAITLFNAAYLCVNFFLCYKFYEWIYYNCLGTHVYIDTLKDFYILLGCILWVWVVKFTLFPALLMLGRHIKYTKATVRKIENSITDNGWLVTQALIFDCILLLGASVLTANERCYGFFMLILVFILCGGGILPVYLSMSLWSFLNKDRI